MEKTCQTNIAVNDPYDTKQSSVIQTIHAL